MSRRQINIRFLFLLTLFAAIIARLTPYVAAWEVKLPELATVIVSSLMVGFVLSLLLALVGVAFLGFSLLTIGCILWTNDDADRQENVNRCIRLAVQGCVAVIPTLICWLLLMYALA